MRHASLYVTLISTLSSALYSSDINTVNGIAIEPANILTLSKPLPDTIKATVLKWIHEHANVIKYIMQQRNPLSCIRKEMDENNQALKKDGLENWSTWNYVIPLSVESKHDYCVQISGPLIKRGNIATFNNTCCDNLPKDTIDALIHTVTYQTVSRLAHYLRFTEFCSRYKPQYLEAPSTYALQLPWITTAHADSAGAACASSATVSKDAMSQDAVVTEASSPAPVNAETVSTDDTSLVVIQKIVPGTRSLKELLTMRQLTNAEILELYNMAKYVGYWDNFKFNILTHNNKFCVVDFEQPGNSNPKDFFHKNRAKYAWNLIAGIKQLVQLVPPDSEPYNFVKKLVLDDAELQQLEHYQLLPEYFATQDIIVGLIKTAISHYAAQALVLSYFHYWAD